MIPSSWAKQSVWIHGWGQSERVWYQQRALYPEATWVNLPGHGTTPCCEDWLAYLDQSLPHTPSILVGWSLGGMLAMAFAHRYPHRVAGLVLIGSTAKFFQHPDWHFGAPLSVYRAFESGLASAPEKTLNYFLKLMFHGDGLARKDFNLLVHGAIDRHHPPSHATLMQGLDLLRDLDLRQPLAKITQPCLLMHGVDDAVVPLAASEYMAQQLADATLHRFEACGHAPFLTQPQRFEVLLEGWCQNLIQNISI
ncbi:MAG: alpha/beta fold hydrolase [Zetaproteobacteria bacterium]|nr:alpha/beta fold hydrolase [Zetaproteobacteria bacterium]